MTIKRSSLSLEYVKVAVVIKQAGAIIDPTALPVEMAFKEPQVEPVGGDWQTASWETAGSNYLARCLVGPGGTIALTDGTYIVWVKVTGSPEIPVRAVETLEIL